jgi:uncharacterized protein (DUF2249 family)
MTTTFVDLDVRPTLRAGGEPFEQIMAAVGALRPGQGLRLFATFRPTPLLHVLGSKGFSHEATELPGGEWEVLFRPSDAASKASAPAVAPADDSEWSEPVRYLDNRDLDPPEPMVRILAATESMQRGEVLSALLCREPMFLFPELAKRGHRWRGAFEAGGKTYKLFVRVGSGVEAR